MPYPVTPSGKVLIGRDVSAYIVQGGGYDFATINTFQAGNIISMLGAWESIEIKFKNNWVDVSASSASEPEKRRTMYEWTASLKSRIRGTGSVAIDMMGSNDYILVSFTDVTGRVMQLIGGISEAGYNRDKDAGTGTLEIESVGTYNGAPSITYV